MVEETDETPPSGRTADWASLYERWRRGEDPEVLARAYGLAQSTVIERCRWVTKMFPPDAPARLRHRFAARLRAAETALDCGAPAEAERRAKALVALVRAARTLEDWSEPEPAAPAAAREARGDRCDAKAELERTLLAYVRRQRALKVGGLADDGAGGSGTGRSDGVAPSGAGRPAAP